MVREEFIRHADTRRHPINNERQPGSVTVCVWAHNAAKQRRAVAVLKGALTKK